MKEEAMCPCCVQSMLKLNINGTPRPSPSGESLTTVLDAVLSRVSEAQERFKRCCIAFADMCCASSKTETGCCENACQDKDGCSIPHLDYTGGTYAPTPTTGASFEKQEGLVAEGTEVEASVKEEVVLEVIGMDCPDCLSKVTQAVRVLSGAEVINADGVRGLVNVNYDPRKLFRYGKARIAYNIRGYRSESDTNFYGSSFGIHDQYTRGR